MIFPEPMKHLIYLLVLASLISCTPKQEVVEEEEEVEDEVYEPYFSLDRAEADQVPSDTSEFMSFDRKGAVPVYPDTAWINEQAETMDEESLSTILDDYSYYEADAMDTLKSVGIEVFTDGLDANKRYYKFKLADGRDFVVDLFKIRGEFGIILYNGKDIPTFCSPMEVAGVMDSVINH